ncbi:MAG: heptosyltransferase-1 [Planctomycetota bacterium]
MTSILLVRLSAMGDLVQSLGAVASLRAAHPDWRVTLVTQREWAPLLEGVEGLDRVVHFQRRGGLPALWALRRELRRDSYDVALDLQGNWKSALVTRLSGARKRIGMAAPWRQEPRSAWLLQSTIECAAIPHPARAAWELVKQVAPEVPFCHPALVATDAEVLDEQAVMAGLGVDVDRPFRVAVVTETSDPRALRPSAVREFTRDGMPTVLLLGPGESGMPTPQGMVVRHGRGDVRRMIALGSLVARAGGEVLGPDQGATHVLLASGASGRVFFGSQDPNRTAPVSAQAFVRSGELACRPCRNRTCSNPEGVVCMQFGPETVTPVASTLPPVGATGPGPWPAADLA